MLPTAPDPHTARDAAASRSAGHASPPPRFCPNSKCTKPPSESSPKTVLEKSFPTQAWGWATSPAVRCYQRRPITKATFFITTIQEGVKKKTSCSELVTLVQQQHLFLKQGTESLKTLGAQSPHANICLPLA